MLRNALIKLVMKPRPVFTTVLELAGFGVIVYGISRISPTDGWISAGCALVVIGALAA